MGTNFAIRWPLIIYMRSLLTSAGILIDHYSSGSPVLFFACRSSPLKGSWFSWQVSIVSTVSLLGKIEAMQV
jgi:hypothetical protein